MKAKDIMIPLQEYVTPDHTLKDAVNKLRSAVRCEDKVGVKGLPVLDAGGRLLGILSMRNILKAVHPEYMSLMNLGRFTWDGMLEDLARKAAVRKVSEFMTREVVTAFEDDPLMECIDLMLKHDIRRLPVVNRQGAVVGMIYEREVFFEVTRSMLDENSGV